VFGDAGELQQVFLNLLLNAVDAVEPGGWVRVGAEASGGQARVWVADNGCGMTEEERAQAFDAFYTTKPVGEGSGLGLFIAYSIVANHGGRLEVVSRKGEGSTFTVVLPQAAPGGAPRSAGA
jgi:two-component system NtrC family sensor kinase